MILHRKKELNGKTHAIYKENESEIEVSPKFYQNIIEMSYSTHYESTKEMQEDRT